LLAHGRWFSPGIPASFTTKTGRHDIAKKILLKVALSTTIQIQNSNSNYSSEIGDLSRIWRSYLGPFVYLLAKRFKLFGFPTCRF
jgi:hypothetical protein